MDAGIVWKEPFRIDLRPLAKAGENALRIEVTNNWNNRLVGDARGEGEHRITRTNLAGKFNERSPLQPSGLIGPVVLQFPIVITSSLSE
ncbi:glycosylhydrolase-like jelly roll fold domain-containing protein [Haloferula sp. A504]|uniref:glycosylhydrolase-like jelly roll fold domain-containing protein n=1 Tax=Haloferula sp. A504 TaxID=3373601 RepID=UPI0031C6891C|nr:hypothetical protein [Verrucomicrobiaceae bacterium E54]